MWFDADGVAHTVAVPDPGQAFAPTLLRAVTSAGARERAGLAEALDEFFGDLYVRLEAEPADTDHLVEVAIPVGLLGRDEVAGAGGSLVGRMRRAVDAVPYEFRLDALLALQDLLDGLEEADDA